MSQTELKTKTFRLSERTQNALKELSELTGLSYDDLLDRAATLLNDSKAVRDLIRARQELMGIEQKSKTRAS
jgi:hypothetical protein